MPRAVCLCEFVCPCEFDSRSVYERPWLRLVARASPPAAGDHWSPCRTLQKNVGVGAGAAGRRPTPPVQRGEWQQTETLGELSAPGASERHVIIAAEKRARTLLEGLIRS